MLTKNGTLKVCLAVASILSWFTLGCGNINTPELKGEEGKAPVSQSSKTAVGSTSSSQSCVIDDIRYPTNEEDFEKMLYGDRGFLAEYNGVKHLGYDVDYAEGTAIHAMTCGKIVFYGPANGYGTLVVVIEVKLPYPMTFENGDGDLVTTDTVLCIYGHLRTMEYLNGGEKLTWKVGDMVQMGDVIGFVQNENFNGDGTGHLHDGNRVQSAAEAKATDPQYWFRGNDTPGEGLFKKYYTDPKQFIRTIQEQLHGSGSSAKSTATSLPLGTLIKTDAGRYELVSDDGLFDVSNVKHLPFECAVNVTQDLLSCYTQMPTDTISLTLDAQVVKFDGEPQVYMLYPSHNPTLIGFHTFLSYESFLSWGYQPADIVSYPLAQKPAIIGSLLNLGDLGLRPGTLVKGIGESEVSVAHQGGMRRPIFNWDVFNAIGHKSSCIYEIDSSTLDAVAGKRSDQVIGIGDIEQCNAPQPISCAPGSWTSCVCGSGVTGSKTCNGDGASYGECECQTAGNGGGLGGDEDAGVDASSSAGGASGSGGQSGSGGSDGSGGTMSVGGSGGAPAMNCTPGQQIGCGCLGGQQGYQVCLSDGLAFGACNCPNVGTGGAGGAGGSTSTGGMGGSTSAGGTSGSGGSGVDAGQVSYCLDPYSRACTTNETRLINCLSGTTIVQTCLADCSGWTNEVCPPANTGGSGGSGVDAGNNSIICQAHGVPGKVVFYANAPVGPNKNMVIPGWGDYPSWCGVPDESWGNWAWGAVGVGELVFQKGDVYQGAKYIFAPGVSSGYGNSPDAWYCDQTGCSIGTFVVCNGLQEACRVQNGVLSGGASYTPNSANWQNILCIL
ncbi:MAG: M23 family metallopeptidase [Patescibacteria group bacterium]|nr:M23 family metallopeptidase [Patescibacteria group bacterium]